MGTLTALFFALVLQFGWTTAAQPSRTLTHYLPSPTQKDSVIAIYVKPFSEAIAVCDSMGNTFTVTGRKVSDEELIRKGLPLRLKDGKPWSEFLAINATVGTEKVTALYPKPTKGAVFAVEETLPEKP